MKIDFIHDIIRHNGIDAVVVEGYDGVGKGKLLNELSSLLEVEPYRPDYNLWNKHNLKKEDRWKISGFFWDVFTHFFRDPGKTLLFDRGVISGAVYNNDVSIAKDYKSMIKDFKILHVLVVCNKLDFYKFQKARLPEITVSEVDDLWKEYEEYTDRYMDYLDLSGVDYVIYFNRFDETYQERTSNKCESCGHYNHGWCRHPLKNSKVNGSSERCIHSTDKEVQDIDEQMYAMSIE